jgi:hypothetical protein
VRLHTQRAEFPPPCESAASQYRVGLLRFESGRVLVVQGGVFECSSRMNGKPSSPVLRGLGASDGARLLDPWDYFPLARPGAITGRQGGLHHWQRADPNASLKLQALRSMNRSTHERSFPGERFRANRPESRT